MPYVNKNLGAIPVYSVDADGNIVSGGNSQVQGNVASGSTDTGNPVKVGGVFTASQSLASGQRGNLLLDQFSNLRTSIRFGDSAAVVTAPAAATGGQFGLATVSQSTVYQPSSDQWFRQPGDTTGIYVHAPANTVDTALSGTIATSGATASVAFTNTTRQEVINPSSAILWARWGAAPTVNGAGSFPIAAGGSFSTDRTNGTLQLLSTAANQNYTVNRYS